MAEYHKKNVQKTKIVLDIKYHELIIKSILYTNIQMDLLLFLRKQNNTLNKVSDF